MAEAVAGSSAAQGALDEFATRTRPFSPPPGWLRPHGRFVSVRRDEGLASAAAVSPTRARCALIYGMP